MNAEKKPDGLLPQHKLYGAVIEEDWAKFLELKVAWHVIERYRRANGNSRASLRYLEDKTRATRPHVIASLRKLVDKGVFSIVRQGKGTRPTEYALNFDFGVKTASGNLEDTATSGIPQETSEVTSTIPLEGASGIPQDTESYLQEPAYSRRTVSRNTTPGAATPPPLAADAATAESPRDPKEGFNEVWEAYGHKHRRADAKHAYEQLAPDAELHATIVQAAGRWREQSAANGTDPKWRKTLANWLKGECWHEDPPPAYEDPKEAAIARAKDRGPRRSRKETTGLPAAEPAAFDGLSPGAPTGRHVVRIVHCDIEDIDHHESIMSVRLRVYGGAKDGTEFEHKFYVTSNTDRFQEEGLRYFSDIRKASGVPNPESTADLVGLVFAATISAGGSVKYEAGSNIAAQQAAAAEPTASMTVH